MAGTVFHGPILTGAPKVPIGTQTIQTRSPGSAVPLSPDQAQVIPIAGPMDWV